VKVIVTGGAGFIGSNLTQVLLEQQAEVYVIDNLSTGKAGNVPGRARLCPFDICQPEAEELIVSLAPDYVFHLAAQADVQRSLADPSEDSRVNVAGTLRILDALRRLGRGKLIMASTSGVYGALDKPLIAAGDPVAPISFYGLSKCTAEAYIRLYHELFGTAYTILRYGNVYGPGQTPKGEGGVVAVFKEQLKKGGPLTVYGDGEQTRDFIYVADIAAANLAAMSSGNGRTLHVSTGTPTSINTLIERITEVTGRALTVHYAPGKPGDIRHSCLDPAETSEVLGWTSSYSLQEGLLHTLQEYPK
jgi:UDP-glucose 4-epimerase